MPQPHNELVPEARADVLRVRPQGALSITPTRASSRLRKHREEACKGPPCRRGESKGLRERDKANAEGREFVQRRHQVD